MISAADQMRIAHLEQEIRELHRRIDRIEHEIRRAIDTLKALEQEGTYEYR
jgi:predicted  nucleic acid-binding Zn-ribbon protein